MEMGGAADTSVGRTVPARPKLPSTTARVVHFKSDLLLVSALDWVETLIFSGDDILSSSSNDAPTPASNDEGDDD